MCWKIFFLYAAGIYIILSVWSRSQLVVCFGYRAEIPSDFAKFSGERWKRTFRYFSYLLFPCAKATIVPELVSSWRSVAAIVNSGTRRSSAAARSKFSSFSRSSLSSPGSSKTQWSVRQDGMRGWLRSASFNFIFFTVLSPQESVSYIYQTPLSSSIFPIRRHIEAKT